MTSKSVKITIDTEDFEKEMNKVKEDLLKYFESVTIHKEPVVYPTMQEYYSKKIKDMTTKNSWLGTIYYGKEDIVADYIDSPSRPLSSNSGITFVSGIFK